jgi:hypothetical protein
MIDGLGDIEHRGRCGSGRTCYEQPAQQGDDNGRCGDDGRALALAGSPTTGIRWPEPNEKHDTP